MKHFFYFFIGVLGAFTIVSCEQPVNESETDELLRLQAYMSIHYPDLQPTSSGSGLYSIILEQGEGELVEEDNYILFNYTGTTLDGTVFDTNNKDVAYLYDMYSTATRYVPKFATYNEISLIKGLMEGISLLKPPAKARFIMPSSLAYGSSSYKGVLPYTSVIFDIELIQVITDPEAYEQAIIDEYISNYFPFGIQDTILRDSVYYLDFEEGMGKLFVKDDVVLVNYIGSFVDGRVFDTNIQSVAVENKIYQSTKDYVPMEMTVESIDIIEGFSLVLKRLKPEGYAKVLITSSKAYGSVGSGSIRPYEPLIFELFVTTKYEEEEED